MVYVQSRYVCYYERLLTELGGELPPPRTLRLSKMVISGLTGQQLPYMCMHPLSADAVCSNSF